MADIFLRVGTCMDLKSCYKYFKIYAFTSRDTWVMGLYNTCSYQSARGRQVFGVCCNNELPAEMPVEEEETNTQVSGNIHLFLIFIYVDTYKIYRIELLFTDTNKFHFKTLALATTRVSKACFSLVFFIFLY